MPDFTRDEIAADRELISRATKGPWEWSGIREKIGDYEFLTVGTDKLTLFLIFYCDKEYQGAIADQRFIAASRTRWPAYVDEVERLSAENERLKTAIRAKLKECAEIGDCADFPDGEYCSEECLAMARALAPARRWRVSNGAEIPHYADPISKDPEADMSAYAALAPGRVVQFSDDGGVTWRKA